MGLLWTRPERAYTSPAREAEITTSGTYTFNLSGGEFVIYAFSLCGVKRTQLLAEHMADARTAMNLLLSTWGTDTPNLWTVDEVVENLVAGTATYNVDPSTVMILDAFIRTAAGTDSQSDRIIWPISRTEYASMPNKTLQAPPTVFWFDRTLAPTLTLWQTPDDQQDYQLHYYRCTVVQDAEPANGQTVQIPRWWQLALAFGLAELLAHSYATDRVDRLALKASNLLREAREQDVENVPLYIMPMVGGYHPRGR